MARRIFIAIAIGAIGALSIAAAVSFLDERQTPLPGGVKADRIVVQKSAHRMSLYSGEMLLRTYRVALARGGMARKEREGDLRMPEGAYIIDEKPQRSQFHRALHISYPGDEDNKAGRTGSHIEIHGLPNWLGFIGSWHRALDWTAGCIAVTNGEMDEVWRAVDKGTPVDIRP
jgi:murein L,D-transpeptidase YafK